VRLEPRVVRHLHALAQEGSSDAGSWKARDNEIVELLPDGERRIRFRPTPARKTPRAVAALCESYRSALENEVAPAALLVATLVFDHLCIHPFRDGNGRVSRLLTTFLLLQQGFEVVRYVSLERLVEESKGDYYRALEASSAGWHAGTNDMTPWWNHFLGILRRAYRALGEQVEAAGSGSGKSALVRRAVQAEVGPFALRELAAQLPAVSRPLLKKVLAQMKAAGEVRLLGRGRGATWEYSGP
jgi:Fic family protein